MFALLHSLDRISWVSTDTFQWGSQVRWSWGSAARRRVYKTRKAAEKAATKMNKQMEEANCTSIKAEVVEL